MARTGTVLIADDDERSAVRLEASLQRAGYPTLRVGTAREALDAVRHGAVALLLLEVVLPDMTGYELCHQLRAEDDELPIFFLSAKHTDPVDRVAGLLLGADDFIVKPFNPSELVARVHRHVRRGSAELRQPAPGPGAELTPREEQVLRLLTRGLRQNDIADELSISPKTVATHTQNLLGKLDVHSRAELVARAYLLGLAGPVGDRRSAVRSGEDEALVPG